VSEFGENIIIIAIPIASSTVGPSKRSPARLGVAV